MSAEFKEYCPTQRFFGSHTWNAIRHYLMSIHVGASVALEISSRNASWVTMGILAGLLYGFCSADDNDNSAGRLFTCAILGGTIMGLMSNVFLWNNILDPTDHFTEDGNKTLHMYSA